MTTGKASSADNRTAEDLFQKNIPLETVEDAIALGCARIWCETPDEPPLEKARSLAYFLPIIDEVAAKKANKEEGIRKEYWVYVRAKVAWLLADGDPGDGPAVQDFIDFCLDIAKASRKLEGGSEDAPTMEPLSLAG